MGRFQILTGLSPEQFLQWCKAAEGVEVQDLIDKTSAEFKPAIQSCYRVAIRSFLRHNGYNSLPKTDLQYLPQAWHRGYKCPEIQTLLCRLRQKIHKLFVMVATESGLRSHVLIELQYRHVMEDLESGTIPIAVRLKPRFYSGKKAAGCTFLGQGSVQTLRSCPDEGLVERGTYTRLIPRSYCGVWAAIHRAKTTAGLDTKIQTCHGFQRNPRSAPDIRQPRNEESIGDLEKLERRRAGQTLSTSLALLMGASAIKDLSYSCNGSPSEVYSLGRV